MPYCNCLHDKPFDAALEAAADGWLDLAAAVLGFASPDLAAGFLLSSALAPAGFFSSVLGGVALGLASDFFSRALGLAGSSYHNIIYIRI